jgi:hypothetical protein
MHVQLWDVTNFLVDGETISDTSTAAYQDGFRINGPASFGVVKNINVIGALGDDTVAILADEPYPNSGTMTASGPINNILISGIHGGTSASQGVRLLSYTSSISNVTVENVDGIYQQWGLWIGSYSGDATKGSFSGIIAQNLNFTYGALASGAGAAAGNESGVSLDTGTIGDVELRDLNLTAANGALGHPITNGAIISQLSIYHLVKNNTSVPGYFQSGGSAPTTLISVNADGINSLPGNTSTGSLTASGGAHVITTSDTSSGAPSSWGSNTFVVGATGINGSGIFTSYNQSTNMGYIGALSPAVSWRSLSLNPGAAMWVSA